MDINNTIIIKGYLVKDIEEHTVSKAGKPFVKFSVCQVNRRNNKPTTHWHQVICYGEYAAALVKQGKLKKGNEVVVRGEQSATQYVDKTGARRFNHDIQADFVMVSEKIFTTEKSVDAAREAAHIDEMIEDDSVPV